jgi:pimeloyl-ACP methyl ester carboxylesterase
MSERVTPFRIEVQDAELRDLRERLGRARWPEEATVEGWLQGVPRSYMQDLCSYWAERYDWRATERRLNAVPQFVTEIDGLGIHFVHVRSSHSGALPLIITHGWPGSVVEFLKVIGPLAEPTAHGGDAADAFHVVCPSLPGYGFSDKPTDRGGSSGEGAHPRRTPRQPDALLASAYRASSARLYWESIRQVSKWISGSTGDTIDVPTGCSIFPKELQRPSRRWAAKRFLDIRYWNEAERGGHFAAFEQPELFVDEVRAFFRLVR